MITSVHLKNFQSHPDTKLDFHPGINSIVGASDKGKSAILRGIRWVIFNRPQGIAHVSDWAKNEKGVITDPCSVEVESSVGKVTRIRSAEMNAYELGTGVILEAVRGDVPTEVTDALRLEEVNVQGQLDAPFLLSASPGEVARFFNKTIKLEEIDQTLSAADSYKREIMADIKSLSASVIKDTETLGAYDWVDGAEVRVEEIEGLHASLEQAKTRLNGLWGIVNEISLLTPRLERANRILAFSIRVTEVKGLNGEMVGWSSRLNSVAPMVTQVKELRETILRTGKFTLPAPKVKEIQAERLNLKEREARRDTIVALLGRKEEWETNLSEIPDLEKAGDLLGKVKALNGAMEVAEETKNLLKKLITSASLYRKDIAEITEEIGKLISSRPETCPTCGGKLEGHDAH